MRSASSVALLICVVGCIPTKESVGYQQNVRSLEILQASGRGDLKAVKALLEKDPDLIHATNDVGATPLSTAVGSIAPNRELIAFLLENGADPNGRGTVPLISATGKGKEDILLLLLAHGADVNKTDKHGNTAVGSAARLRVGAAVKILLAHGAELNIFQAARLNDMDRLRTLLKQDPTLAKASDPMGLTALHYAAGDGHVEAVKLLLAHGASPRVKSKAGFTPYSLALNEGYEEIGKLLAP